MFALCSLLNNWNYFWNKYYNLPFLAICHSLSFLILSKSKNWTANELAKQKMTNCHIKGLYKTACYKTKSNFFFSHWLLHKCFFSFVIKAFSNFEKLIRFHWQAFIVYKNRENLKMLIQVFCQKPIVSNVILIFLLKPKFSS